MISKADANRCVTLDNASYEAEIQIKNCVRLLNNINDPTAKKNAAITLNNRITEIKKCFIENIPKD